MLNGAEFAKLIAPLGPGIERELLILNTFKKQGLAPIGGGGDWAKIRIEQIIAGKNRVFEFEASPVPTAIGTNADPFIVQAWPWTYQAIFNEIKCVLPTKKLAMAIAKAASIKLEPHPFPTCNPTIPGICNGKAGSSSEDGGKYNETGARLAQSNAYILGELAARPDYVPGKLVGGGWKEVLNGPNLDGSTVAIFGWFHANGKFGDNDLDRWQGYSLKHESQYGPDYSHSGRAIRETGWLDGSPILLTELAQDKLLSVLITGEQGQFSLHFPNAAKNVSPPPGYPPGTFFIQPPSKFAAKAGTVAGVVGGVAFGGAVGFAVGGPVGALAGAMLGAALGRA